MSGTPTGAAPPREGAGDRRIIIGTSGYSFADWVGPFYPPGMKSGDFLDYYSRRFEAVEVNATYYRMPEAGMFERMVRKTPEGFRFVIKLNQAMTHENARDPALYREFVAALRPLKEAGRYDGLLAQFPWGFKRTPDHRRHLAAMRDLLAGEPLFVEFRHDSWLTPELEPSLRERGIGYCAVDEPRLPGLVPPVTMVTAEDAYVRFHGRNEATWWGRSGSQSQEGSAGGWSGGRPGGDRYDYDYSADELKEWVRKVAELADQARRTYLFFNNCHAGQAARNARLMQELLRQENLPA